MEVDTEKFSYGESRSSSILIYAATWSAKAVIVKVLKSIQWFLSVVGWEVIFDY